MSDEADTLRMRAERLLKGSDQGHDPEDLRQDALNLVHELNVHRTELAQQNDELRATRRELEEMHERYVDLFEHAPVGYFLLGAGGEVREANVTGLELLGVSRDECVERDFSDFIDPDDQDSYYLNRRQALTQGRAPGFEVRLRADDGSIVRALLGLRREPDSGADGEEPAVLRLTASDLSAQRAAEAGRRRSEARYRALFADTQDAILMLAADGSVLEANAAARSLLGYEPDQLLGQSLAKALGRRETATQILTEVRQGQLADAEVTLERGDGTVMDALATAYLRATAVDDDGGPNLILRDITEQRRLLRELHRSQHQLSRILGATPSLIYVFDVQYQRNLFVNDRSTAILGYTPEQLRAVDVMAELVHPEDRPAMASHFRRLAEEAEADEVFECEYRVRTRAGDWRWLRNYDVVFDRDEDGALLQVLGVAIDVSERREARERIEIYQQQLRSLAAQAATTAERERRKVASDLHDRLGQTLSLISMRVDELSGELGSRGLLEDLKGLVVQADEDVRDMTFELSPPVLQHMGLAAALRWLAERMRQEHDLRVALETGDPLDDLDPDMQNLLFRSVQELLMNVVRHADVDRCELTAHRRDGWVQIELRDAGQGFDRATVEQSSDSFGLFSVRERLSFLQGSFEFDTAPGEGTRCVIKLPLEHSDKGGPGSSG